LGGLIGYFAESVHRRAGVWTLPGDGPMPLWVAGVYALGIALLSEGFRRFELRHELRLSRRRAAAEAALLSGLFLLPPLLHQNEWLLLAVSTAYLAGRLAVGRAEGDVAVAVAVAAADLAIERSLIAAGLFRYAHATHAIPLWLAPLWGGMAISLRRIFQWMEQPGGAA
jgi:Protein of unknown function (DUF2878)